ncbi:hypothetical protein DFJ73DRAFT_656655, partial [Zopfochytrium polystomum]
MMADSSAQADDHPAAQSDFEKYWALVSENPDDFASWESLIRTAEAAGGGISKDWPLDHGTNLRTVYDHFLSKFPLCFGYWKKYADAVLTLEGVEKAEAIYERAVLSIHNSVDFWTHFCLFKSEKCQDEEEVRGVFERAAAAVGFDFLSHPFWDKYIDFEETKQHPERVIAILERIIRIPLHQYSRYFEKYSQLSVTRPVTELLPLEEIDQLQSEIRHDKATNGAEAPAGTTNDSDIEAELRQRIHSIKSAIYLQTQDAVHKRWVFESEIKRPYFHIKPLDEGQLQNWRKYLDFEETADESDLTRVYILYERCLVACALYEEFWLRYVKFLVSKGDSEGARNAFIRASSIFLPPGRTEIRLAYAAFEEQHGRVAEAKELYVKQLESVAGHAETIYKYAHFLRRHSGYEAGLEFLNKSVAEATDEKLAGFLAATKAKYIYQTKADVDGARAVYVENASTGAALKYFVVNYFLFEVGLPGATSREHVDAAWQLVKQSEALNSDEKTVLGQKYADFCVEHLASIADANEIEQAVYQAYSSPAALAAAAAAGAAANGSGASSKKRSASVSDDNSGSP